VIRTGVVVFAIILLVTLFGVSIVLVIARYPTIPWPI
jgi:hypothetical protein